MRTAIALCVIIVGCDFAMAAESTELHVPSAIESCVSPLEEISVVDSRNPFYLRGDFDGDGRVDYAVSVQSVERNHGVVLCGSKMGRVVVGPVGRSRSAAQVPADVFAPMWEVVSKNDLQRRRRDGESIPSTSGEAILMLWEDAVGILYWDGKHVKWCQIEGHDD